MVLVAGWLWRWGVRDWAVTITVGQTDAGGMDGLGKHHIESGHSDEIAGWPTMKRDIAKDAVPGPVRATGQQDDVRSPQPFLREPHAGGMKVVFTERADSRSRDRGPVGIITAYSYGCGC
ncbi:hypothetical protein [Streptomyces hydrogenans]|uniref:hypothetical protein n=1 Tax=Streptomyces hydrogenans TaxID=1873719 RepID=UPI00343A274E